MKKSIRVFELKDSDLPLDRQSIMYGSIKQIRKWCKNRWKADSEFIIELTGITEEEDFYYHLDDDANLLDFISDMGYYLVERCKITLDDFNEGKPSQELIDEVIEEIKRDISSGDLTALDELLKAIPLSYLNGYLPEK